ncbi:MFS transporter [Bacillus sp. DHT2]|uniref:MFS transporter n=1 Tax=Bacillus sp. DHT2 TaxID=2994532 RepID=UPI002248FB2C|nr:MFS transporter [Bacillus sp. DHT2]
MRNKNFLNFFIGNTITFIGNGMYFIALSWLVLLLSGTTSAMGWLLAISAIPGILFSPIIGVCIDRWDRRIICVAGDIFRGFLLLVIPLLYYLDKLEIGHLYIVGFFLSIGNRFYYPASGGLVKEIVPEKHLLSANSLSNIFAQTGLLVGAGIGGVLIMYINPIFNIWINAATFFISSIFTIFVRSGIVHPQNQSKRKKVLKEYILGLNYLKYRPYIIGISVLQVFLYISFYTTNIILPAYSKEVLKVGSTGFGLIDAAWAAGAIVGGALLLSVFFNKFKDSNIIKCGFLVLSPIILLFSISQNLIQAMIGYFLMGLLFVNIRIKIDTIIQSEVENKLQGRVKSTIYMVIDFISLAVYLGIGYLGDLLSLRIVYGFIGLLIFCAFIISFPVFKLKRVERSREINSKII